jgi:cation diffusion facilitator family transporter
MTASSKLSIIPNYGNVKDPEVRAKYGYLEAGVSIIGNFFLFLLKLILGLFINSIALIADAFHTLSDVGTSGVVILGFKISKKPPDKTHPFGHGRVEYIATLIIAILLVIVGLNFIWESIERFIIMEELINMDLALIIGIVVIISAIAKEAMAQFSSVIGKKIQSDILIADAWHHRSDAIASIAVGISIIGSSYGYPILDPIFGVIVSLIIIYVGIDLVKRTSNILIGPAPDDEIINKIRRIADSVTETKGIDEIFIHDYGVSKIASLHVNVEKGLSLDEAHGIADKIENKIWNIIGYSTIIHMEPEETSTDEKISKIIIKNILEEQKEIKSFHKIQIIRYNGKEDIKMHIVVDRDMSIDDSHKLFHRLKSIIKKEYGATNVDIHLEPCEKVCEACTASCNNKGESNKE